ncbi:hypothetical protein Dda_8863 [Drechslerella dactyloides]|uniref:Uncharacterized protein n=1 Tax=Drechslerella dactyloides TaxID=74499 RepID=A0AAD6IQ78_DREDA|nr:hypothetical protein Dda_8863 [Drechslerella dactyloides]
MELRVVIPIAASVGVLIIIIVVLIVWIIVRSQKRKRKARDQDWRQHEPAEDTFSIAWSDHGDQGLTRSVSVRNGKLVRNQSARKGKDGSRTVVESTHDDNDAHPVKRDLGSSDFMNSISNITGRISPGIGRALSVGSHKTSAISSEKSRQLSPLPPTDEENRACTVHLLDVKRPYSANRSKHSSHSRSSSRSNIHDGQVAEFEDMTLQGRDSVLLPSPPSSARILTPTQSRHSYRSQSNSSFTFTPVTPRASVSLFPLSAPPGQPRKPSAAAQNGPASYAFPAHLHSARRPSFLQNSYTHDHPIPSPSTSMFELDSGLPTLADYADELRPRSAGRPTVSKIQIPDFTPASPRALRSFGQDSANQEFPEHIPDHHSQVENFDTWNFSDADPSIAATSSEAIRPPYTRAPSSAVGNQSVGGAPFRKESFASYAQMRRDSFRRDSFGGGVPTRRESHGPSVLRRDSTASFLGTTPPKFATGPRVYYQHQLPSNPLPPQRESISRAYSDRSVQSTHTPTLSERQLDPMNMIPSINESKSSIVSVSSTGSAASDSFAADGGLSPPPLQKTSFESTRADPSRSIDHAPSLSNNGSTSQLKPPVTPPRHTQGQPFNGSDGRTVRDISLPNHHKDNGGLVPETVAEASRNIPASPTSTITTATVTENSAADMSPERLNGGT